MFQILSQRLVKPSTPTPPSLRYHKLSLNDQIEGGYIPLNLFYPNLEGCYSPVRSATETSQILENALSKTLSYYYPFAGRLRDNLYIECNDMGAYFTAARIKCKMIELKKQQMQRYVFPHSLISRGDDDPSLLHVQLTYFNCGGMAVALWLSHKLADLSTSLTFSRDWVAMVHQPSYVPTPQFNVGVSLFPPIEDTALVKEISFKQIGNNALNLIFRGPKIQELKDMVAATSGVEKPSRVEVVTALLYKCALDSSRKISGSFRSSVLVHSINLRSITVPPLPKEVVGNISVGLVIPTPMEDEITLPGLVSKIRNVKVNLRKEYREAKSNAAPSVKLAMALNFQSPVSDLDNMYVCTSWCGFPIYDFDFGRGKASEMYIPDQGGVKNIFILRDARNEDAIEAFAALEEPEMSAFAISEELLAFASLSE